MPVDLQSIINAHKAATRSAGTKKAIDSLHSELEKLLEDYGQSREFDAAATDYLKEKSAEIKSIRRARNWMLRLGFIMAVTTLSLFYFILLCPRSSFHLGSMTDGAKSTFIIASFGDCVVDKPNYMI